MVNGVGNGRCAATYLRKKPVFGTGFFMRAEGSQLVYNEKILEVTMALIEQIENQLNSLPLGKTA